VSFSDARGLECVYFGVLVGWGGAVGGEDSVHVYITQLASRT